MASTILVSSSVSGARTPFADIEALGASECLESVSDIVVDGRAKWDVVVGGGWRKENFGSKQTVQTVGDKV